MTRALDGMRGQNISASTSSSIDSRLLESPWVESAELWRVLPSTVQVRIVERTPLAVARLRGQLFLVDVAGVIIDSYGPRYGDLDLPVVDGLLTARRSGGHADAARIALVQRVFREALGAAGADFRRCRSSTCRTRMTPSCCSKDEPAELPAGRSRLPEAAAAVRGDGAAR